MGLSAETARRVDALFLGAERASVIELLSRECGANLPFCEDATPESSERIRFAVLKLSGGAMDELRRAIETAKQDWRDVLVAAGFGESVQAHKKWEPRPGSGKSRAH